MHIYISGKQLLCVKHKPTIIWGEQLNVRAQSLNARNRATSIRVAKLVWPLGRDWFSRYSVQYQLQGMALNIITYNLVDNEYNPSSLVARCLCMRTFTNGPLTAHFDFHLSTILYSKKKHASCSSISYYNYIQCKNILLKSSCFIIFV